MTCQTIVLHWSEREKNCEDENQSEVKMWQNDVESWQWLHSTYRQLELMIATNRWSVKSNTRTKLKKITEKR